MGRSNTIGVVVTSIADPFVAGVVRGIEDMAEERGYSVFLANSNAEPERELRVARSFEERRVDGIIVTSSRVGALHVPLMERMHVPVVLLNNQHPSEFVHSVLIDNVQASMDATRHLLGLGHQRIAYLGDRFGHQSDTERFTGYRRAMEEAGLGFDPALVVHGDGKPEGGELAIAHLLELPHRPTAVFCYNDMSALGALRQIRAYGLTVPGDLSVVGFDDLFFCQYLEPPLTTVRQPLRQHGAQSDGNAVAHLRGAALDLQHQSGRTINRAAIYCEAEGQAAEGGGDLAIAGEWRTGIQFLEHALGLPHRAPGACAR